MGSLLVALVLSSSPFPPPHRTVVTDATKCDWGTVLSVTMSGEPQTLVVQTAAGPVTYLAPRDTPVFSAQGNQQGTVATLQPASRVRVYFVLENGARASEVDLEP